MKIYIDFDGVILDTDNYIDSIYTDKSIKRNEFIKRRDRVSK